MFIKLVAAPALIAAAICGSIPAMSGEFPPQEQHSAVYRPIQIISYTFGSKAMSGYFVQEDSVCRVTLMVAERIDPNLPQLTAARVRLALEPGQVAGIDSEEGRSLNLTCGEGAATVVVDYGERSELVAQQGPTATTKIAGRIHQ